MIRAVHARWPWVLLLVLGLGAGVLRSASAEELAKAHFRLPLEYEHFSYLGARGGVQTDSRNALTAIPEVEWAPSESIFFRFSLALRQDFSEEERSRIYPYEGFLDLDRETWAARIGRQFITWGRADSLKPTDVFKRHDYTDLIEDREEAIDAVKLDLFPGGLTLEGVWVPVFDPDMTSFRAENRWTALPEEGEVPGLGRARLTFREGRRVEPSRTLESGQIGVRLNGSSRGWDFAGMYYYGYDRVPTIIRQEVTRVDPVGSEATITLVPVHKRIHIVGGDFATVISEWGLRAEAAYTLTTDLESDDSEVGDPYLRFTGGVDRTFSRIPVGQSLFVIVEYALDTELPQRGAANQEEVGGLLHFFRHALLLNTTWKYTEFLRVRLEGFVNLEEGDFVLQPELSWQPMDGMTIVLGGDVLGGRRDTFFGTFRDNDRVRVRISYAF
ncbi:MAG: DUF1302 family protein [Candidatus Methylomirabilia bacterium]